MTRFTPTVVAPLLASLLLSGCGVSTQGSAEITPAGDVPFGLTESPRTTTTLPSGSESLQVYLLDPEGRLVPVDRHLDVDGLHDVVDALLGGPTTNESTIGLTSALDDPAVIRAVELAGGVASVDLAESFGDLGAEAQRSALAQIVFTLTGRPGVGLVAFTLDGQPIEIPTGDGSLTTGSVSRDSFRELLPPT